MKKILNSNVLFAIILIYFIIKQIPMISSSYKNEGIKISPVKIQSIYGESSIIPLPNKKTVILFWASWCGPCRIQFELLETFMSDELIRDKRIIALSMSESKLAVKKYIKKNNLAFNSFIGGANLMNEISVLATPSVVFIGEDGIVKYSSSGISPSLPLRIKSFLN